MEKQRSEAMAAMYKTGACMAEIGRAYGISRERVRQILKKIGIDKNSGGRSLWPAARKKSKEERARLRFIDRYGCDPSSVGDFSAADRKRFLQQRSNAVQRGISFRMTSKEWLDTWRSSGHYHERGQGLYVMGRRGDSGAYEVGNVYICTSSQNFKDSYINKPYHTRRHAEAMAARKKPAPKGWSKNGKRYGSRFMGKWGAFFDTPEEARAHYLSLFSQHVCSQAHR